MESRKDKEHFQCEVCNKAIRKKDQERHRRQHADGPAVVSSSSASSVSTKDEPARSTASLNKLESGMSQRVMEHSTKIGKFAVQLHQLVTMGMSESMYPVVMERVLPEFPEEVRETAIIATTALTKHFGDKLQTFGLTNEAISVPD